MSKPLENFIKSSFKNLSNASKANSSSLLFLFLELFSFIISDINYIPLIELVK